MATVFYDANYFIFSQFDGVLVADLMAVISAVVDYWDNLLFSGNHIFRQAWYHRHGGASDRKDASFLRLHALAALGNPGG